MFTVNIMVRCNALTSQQKLICLAMRDIRKEFGMSRPFLANLSGMTVSSLAAREGCQLPWKEGQDQQALSAVIKHFTRCIELAKTLEPSRQTKRANNP